MATEPILAALDVAEVRRRHGLVRSSVLSSYWSLTKPEVNFLIGVTVAAGFWMGVPASLAHFPWSSLLHTLVGTVLVASGAATLNQLIELRFDARMRRTARRPLVSQRIEPSHALWFGISLAVVGAIYLAVTTNALASLLSIFTLLGYLFLYTPLKRKTPLCTLIGALPGGTPPLIGWAAACGHLDGNAWLLFVIVFLWQFPHFSQWPSFLQFEVSLELFTLRALSFLEVSFSTTAHALLFKCLLFLHGACFLLPSSIFRCCLLSSCWTRNEFEGNAKTDAN